MISATDTILTLTGTGHFVSPTAQWGGGATPVRVSKRSVVELIEKTGLVLGALTTVAKFLKRVFV